MNFRFQTSSTPPLPLPPPIEIYSSVMVSPLVRPVRIYTVAVALAQDVMTKPQETVLICELLGQKHNIVLYFQITETFLD